MKFRLRSYIYKTDRQDSYSRSALHGKKAATRRVNFRMCSDKTAGTTWQVYKLQCAAVDKLERYFYTTLQGEMPHDAIDLTEIICHGMKA